MMSTGSTVDQSILVMSPWLGTVGQWWARIRLGASSNSDTQAVSAPNTCSTARAKPPNPAHSSPTRKCLFTMRLSLSGLVVGPESHHAGTAYSLPTARIDVCVYGVERMSRVAVRFPCMVMRPMAQLVLLVLRMSSIPEIRHSVIVLITVQVPDLHTLGAWAKEGQCY